MESTCLFAHGLVCLCGSYTGISIKLRIFHNLLKVPCDSLWWWSKYEKHKMNFPWRQHTSCYFTVLDGRMDGHRCSCLLPSPATMTTAVMTTSPLTSLWCREGTEDRGTTESILYSSARLSLLASLLHPLLALVPILFLFDLWPLKCTAAGITAVMSILSAVDMPVTALFAEAESGTRREELVKE